MAGLRRWYAVMLVGGALGILTAAWQTVDRIGWAANPNAGSICEINSVLSCSSVFSHWQSSALGIPNSLIALPLFGLFAATGLAGVLGSDLSRGYLGTVFGMNVGLALFITWYLQQSAFPIGVLCLFCLGCGVNAVIAGIGVTRVAAAQQALGDGRVGQELRRQVAAGADLIAWVGLLLVWAAMLVVGLAF
jgi:uncharacterized membrane protein